MKSYICAILLLICGGMGYSATQVRGGCLFGKQVVSVGKHTAAPCMELICDTYGQVTMAPCPSMACNPGQEATGMMPERPGKPFPDCCAQPICKGRHYPEVADLPYFLPQMESE
ncbi:uncharacterized protein LOC112460756 [Temnothorax curvispinosus]|uniref:Uncharacterized protein LOC112460756 n=1 Tax=Temnothorax curvispinosus TaxID=300111 RepID=A0A6J1QHP8_9HYME|nr:uncharacterized protein LOC112460756 [Temnothorax curvispinosus]